MWCWSKWLGVKYNDNISKRSVGPSGWVSVSLRGREVESQHPQKNFIFCYSDGPVNGPNKRAVGPAAMGLFSKSVRTDLRIQTGRTF